jgi:hypothetical protein
MWTLIEQSIHKRKKVYCCFVDFRKAFDKCPVICYGKC